MDKNKNTDLALNAGFTSTDGSLTVPHVAEGNAVSNVVINRSVVNRMSDIENTFPKTIGHIHSGTRVKTDRTRQWFWKEAVLPAEVPKENVPFNQKESEHAHRLSDGENINVNETTCTEISNAENAPINSCSNGNPDNEVFEVNKPKCARKVRFNIPSSTSSNSSDLNSITDVKLPLDNGTVNFNTSATCDINDVADVIDVARPPGVGNIISTCTFARLTDDGNNLVTTARIPTKPFTSWRAMVYYMKSGERTEENRLSGGTKAVQRYRKPLNAKLNNSITMDVDVDNDLQCPICLELYTYPIILPCSHVLCRSPCAEHLFDFNFIRCPVCRDNCYVSGGIASLPRVIALENIIDRYKTEQKKEKSAPTPVKSSCSKQTSQSPSIVPNGASSSTTSTSSRTETDIKCQHCKHGAQKRAKKLCVTCGSHFCATCLRLTHPNKEPYTNHEFAEPGSAGSSASKASSANSNRKSNSTLLHRKVIDSYCRLCTQPYCSHSEDGAIHETHSVIPIEEAYREYKNSIGDSSDKLSNSQSKVVTSLKCLKDRLKDVQHVLTRRRDDINMQFDALLAEIENKRSYFLADLEYEERIHQTAMEDNIKMLEKMLGSSQGLQGYVQDMLAAEKAPFLEVANTLNERLVKATLDCESASVTVPVDNDVLQNKVVDCRREKVLLRELTYLSPPSTPIVDVTRCSRSENAVVLALCPPSNVHEVVDQYEIHFCSEEQKNIQLEETQLVKNFVEDSCSTKISANSSGILVVLIENLCRSTTYYFCLSASNSAGKSGSSEVVQCTTLAQEENVIPVPVIIDSLCKRFTSSIQIFSSSPMDVAVEQKISHFLLYRQPSYNRVWKCVSMYGREEHRVFGLEPSTEYEFVILAYNLRGECQLSNKVVMETEIAANY